MNTSRRSFVTTGLVASLTFASAKAFAQTDEKKRESSSKPITAELPRAPRQDLDLVQAFVRAGHSDLAKVKELVAQDPKLVLASWDWGKGDWETALGGAAHLGNRDIALYLLEQGARLDSFAAAMLGQRDVITAMVTANPSVATTKGPHGFTLLYHAAISGDIAIAQALKPHLAPNASDYNQALGAAARSGHAPLTSWLLRNGVTDPNVSDFLGKTPLMVAKEKGFNEVVEELEKARK